MRSIFFTLALIATFYSSGQTFEHQWFIHETQSSATNPSSKTAIVRTTSDNGVIFVTLESPVLDDGIGTFGTITLRKISPTNNEEWSIELTDAVRIENVETASDGRIFVAGSYYDDIHFSSGQHLPYQPTGFALSNMFLFCLEHNGEIAWTKNMSSDLDGMSDYIHTGLAIGNDGQVHCAYTTYQDAYFISFDAEGDSVNSFEATGVQVIGGLKCDSENNLYVSGAAHPGDVIFPGFQGNAPYDYNAFVAKVNSDQDGGWIQFYEDVTNQFVSLALNAQEQPAIAYALFLDIMVGDILLTAANFGSEFALIQLDQNGTPLWATSLEDAQTLGGLTITDRNTIRADQSGNIWLGAQVNGTLAFSGNFMLEAGSFQNYENALLSFNNQGHVTTAAFLTGGGYDKLYAFDPNAAQGLYYAGYFTESYQPLPFTMPSEPSNYRVMGKLQASEILHISIVQPHHHLSAYPNPASDRLTLQCDATMVGEEYVVYDALGREVLRGRITSTSTQLDIQRWSAGEYVVRIGGSSVNVVKR